jgi:hypothetical protein
MFTTCTSRTTLKMAVATALIGLAVGSAVAEPTGSFARTCKDISVSGGSVFATCQRMNGSWIKASLEFTRCSGHSMTNLDGVLVCGP